MLAMLFCACLARSLTCARWFCASWLPWRISLAVVFSACCNLVCRVIERSNALTMDESSPSSPASVLRISVYCAVCLPTAVAWCSSSSAVVVAPLFASA